MQDYALKDHESSSSTPATAASSDEKAVSPGQSSPPVGTIELATVPAAVDEPEQPVRTLKGIKWIICVLSIFSSVFLYALDNTIVATIQPAIINDLGHIEKLPWVSVAYQVASVALDLTWYACHVCADFS